LALLEFTVVNYLWRKEFHRDYILKGSGASNCPVNAKAVGRDIEETPESASSSGDNVRKIFYDFAVDFG